MFAKHVAAFLFSCAFAFAQSSAQWVALDTSKEGTPAEIRMDRTNSDANKTELTVVIHGFYVEQKQGPDGRYQKISVPGLNSVAPTGSPDLPAFVPRLAIPTDAKAVRLAAFKPASSPRTFTGMNIWPKVIPGLDQENGTAERFVKDAAVYALKTPWPATDGAGSTPSRTVLADVSGAAPELYPIHWTPASGVLTVFPAFTAVFDHSGAARKTRMGRDRARLAQAQFHNWEVVGSLYEVNLVFYEGDFLFIYPDGYKNELQPLINQKKARGFYTTEKTTTQTGKTCAGVRAAIQSWYNSRPAYTDKYALLVGDVNEIPLCTSPTGVPTDDLYGSVNGDDLDEEVFVGRLSVDSESDLTNQVSKILGYEDAPSLFCCYNKALLVAHKENAPGKYVGAHESVRTASYAVPPTFSTLYGHIAGVDDTDVSLAINSGLGLVAYRGHGSSSAWTGWNLGNEYYDSGDVTGLGNLAPQVPVVWSFACTNSSLSSEDSVGEIWMEDFNNRAAAFYGATVPSYTDQNHELDRQMFKAVYDLGLTIHSHAIKYAEERMADIVGSSNAWMYLLLGDPEMKVRRRNPLSFKIEVPVEYKPCYGPGCYLQVSVFDEVGNPAPFVKVSAWKSVGIEKDEILVNRYTDKAGKVQIPVSGITAGELLLSFTDDAGISVTRKVSIK